MTSDWGSVALAIGAIIGVGLTGTVSSELASSAFTRAEEKLRARLRKEVFGSLAEAEDANITLDQASTIRIDDDAPSGRPSEAHETESAGSSGGSPGTDIRHHGVASNVHNARFGLLLVDYYAFGLTQARRSFAVSMACSVLGGLVLIAGVALAIFRADTNGEVYAGVVTSVAGVMTTSIGVLFHQQANRALKHMEDQTKKLRQDMKAETDAGTALELLDKVADDRLRGRLQAALILRFSAAELPDIDAFGSPIHTSRYVNGAPHTASPHTPPSQSTAEI